MDSSSDTNTNEIVHKSNLLDFFKDFLTIQKNIKTIKETGYNPHFKSNYVELDHAVQKIYPILNEAGFIVFQPIVGRSVHTLIVHAKTGQFMKWETEIPYKGEDSQKFSGANTYIRRISLLAALGIAPGDDDDGNKASLKEEPISEPKAKKPLNPFDPKRALPNAAVNIANAVAQSKFMKIPEIKRLEYQRLHKILKDSNVLEAQFLKSRGIINFANIDERTIDELIPFLKSKIETQRSQK